MENDLQRSRSLIIMITVLTLFIIAAGSLMTYGAGFMLQLHNFKTDLAESMDWASGHGGMLLSLSDGESVSLTQSEGEELYERVTRAAFLPLVKLPEGDGVTIDTRDGAKLRLWRSIDDDRLCISFNALSGRTYTYELRYPNETPLDVLLEAHG